MAEPMTPDELSAYVKLADNIRERFGDNLLIAFDPECDNEASVRTEESTPTFFTEMFSTSQTLGEDPLEVAGFLAAAIDNVPRMAAMIRQGEAEVERLREEAEKQGRLRRAENRDVQTQRSRAEKAEAERDRARGDLAEERARHGELIAEMQRTRRAADDARAETSRLTDRLDNVGGRVFQAFIDADIEATDLNAMTPAQLGDLVMSAIRRKEA